MIRIYILALRKAVLASIADARYLFLKVNDFMEQSGRSPLFEVQLAGLWNKVELEAGLFTLHPQVLLPEAATPSLVIIPAMEGDMLSATYLNKEYGEWIARLYKEGAQVASLCVGAFLLAYSGILKNKQCTTHWQYANEFRQYYPSVKLANERIITDQSGLYSSGGSNSYWNLLLYLVEKYTDRETAIFAAKYFAIDIDRSNQCSFVVFNGLKDHDDEQIKEAQDYIEKHYREKITVDQLAGLLNISRRTFERRFKKATYHTVAGYIQQIKIEAARKQLETGRKTIGEIMGDVGYTDVQAFRDVFKRIAGSTPAEYKNKYNP